MAFSVFGDQLPNNKNFASEKEMNGMDWKTHRHRHTHVSLYIDCMWYRINTYSTKLNAIYANLVSEWE